MVYIFVFIIKKNYVCILFEIICRNVYYFVLVIMLWVWECEWFLVVFDLELDFGGWEFGVGIFFLLFILE